MTSIHATLKLYQTTIGKKAAMAATGSLLFLFVVGHMIGNLQVFAGPEKLDAYAKFLHSNMGILWVVRLVMLTAISIHVYSALSLWLLNRNARKQRYQMQRAQASTISSRTMIIGGVAIFSFVAYHLAHLTTGHAHHGFIGGAVYCNVVTGFRIWWVASIYIVAQIFVGLHLYHGVWSLFQTLGLISPRWDVRFRRLGAIACGLIVVGNISMPAAALAGLLPLGVCS